MIVQAELIGLLASPNESLTIEYKSWLPLSEKQGCAALAKAAIALANHGGGMVVLGMRENKVEEGAIRSQPRPEGVRPYRQDDVNAAINRYADPPLHCELSFAEHPETAVQHAFVRVPGGHRVPIMSKRDYSGVIAAQRCYIRKPGPRSEEPHTAEEWRGLLDQCVRTGRENMLDAIRLIVQGHPSVLPPAGEANACRQFVSEAQDRWQQLINPLPEADPARMPNGHYELICEIENAPPASNLRELLRRMDTAGTIRHTGWRPFVTLGRAPFEPIVVDGLIETWLGHPEEGAYARTPGHCDFWRADLDGRLFLLRGYDEDGNGRVEPGTCIGLTLPIWRVGEAMLYVARLAKLFADDPSVFVGCRYTGLQNRVLSNLGGGRYFLGHHVCSEQEVSIETQALASEIDNNLAEILHSLLAPLYERFSFFELPMTMVASEIESMRRTRF